MKRVRKGNQSKISFKPTSFSYVGTYVRTRAHASAQLAIGLVTEQATTTVNGKSHQSYVIVFFDGTEGTMSTKRHDFVIVKSKVVQSLLKLEFVPFQNGDHVEVLLSPQELVDGIVYEVVDAQYVIVDIREYRNTAKTHLRTVRSVQIRHHPVIAPLRLTRNIGTKVTVAHHSDSILPTSPLLVDGKVSDSLLVSDIRFSAVSSKYWARVTIEDNTESSDWLPVEQLSFGNSTSLSSGDSGTAGEVTSFVGRRALFEGEQLATVVGIRNNADDAANNTWALLSVHGASWITASSEAQQHLLPMGFVDQHNKLVAAPNTGTAAKKEASSSSASESPPTAKRKSPDEPAPVDASTEVTGTANEDESKDKKPRLTDAKQSSSSSPVKKSTQRESSIGLFCDINALSDVSALEMRNSAAIAASAAEVGCHVLFSFVLKHLPTFTDVCYAI